MKFFATNMLTGGLAGALTLPIGFLVGWPVKIAQADLRPEGTRLSGFGHCKSLLAHPLRTGSLIACALPLSAFGIVMYRAPYFGIFDTLKEINPFKEEAKKGTALGLFSKFVIAQTTAIIAGFISYPFDTVRRRLQMQAEKPKEQWLYSGTLDCAVKIVKDEGMGAMFKGFAANVLRTLGGALVLVGYDEIKRLIA